MDTTAMRPAELTPENTAVIGLNGKPVGRFGFSLPVVRHNPSGLCCVLSYSRKPGLAWTSESDLREMDNLGRLTRFERPLKLPTDSTGQGGRQPVVVWAESSLVESLGRLSPGDFIKAEGDLTLFCALEDEVELLFQLWAKAARVRFDELLSRPNLDWEDIGRFADIGVQTARSLPSRYWGYVRKGVALYFRPGVPPEAAYQLFRAAVQPLYKTITWKRFLEAMEVVYDHAASRRRAAARSSRTAHEVLGRLAGRLSGSESSARFENLRSLLEGNYPRAFFPLFPPPSQPLPEDEAFDYSDSPSFRSGELSARSRLLEEFAEFLRRKEE